MKKSKLLITLMLLMLKMNAYSQNFIHPGIMNSKSELDFIKSKVAANEQPWKNAYDQMKASKYGSLTYKANAIPTTDCGSYNTDANGNYVPQCSTFVDDAMAAYTDALIWYISEDKRYATKAISIINTWSSVYVSNIGSNAILNVSWATPWYINAAEILKHGNSGGTSGWNSTDNTKFNSMISKFLTYVTNANIHKNNWIQSAIEAHIAIAVYTDNRTEFNKAVNRWKAEKTYIYQLLDGPIPSKFKSTSAIEGLCLETQRDLGHVKLGIKSMIYAAQIAYEQGTDLFSLEQKRLTDFLELHGSWMTGSVAVPFAVNKGKVVVREKDTQGIKPPTGGGQDAFEIAYSHLHNRLNKNLPYTQQMITNNRPSNASHWVAKWETLTHANLYNSSSTTTNHPPVVNFILPSSTSFVAPATLIMKVSAVDNDSGDSITNVKLYKNGAFVRQENIAPYDWNHTGQDAALNNLAAGTYTFKAVATDAHGATGEKSITITVTSSTNPCTGVANPSVSISSPLHNSNFNQGQNVTITAATSSSVAITKVEFYDGATLVGTDTSAPYTFTSNSLSIGTHNFTAKTYNTCNKTATSTNVTVKINAVITPQADISGPSCTNPLQTLTYQINPALTVNATSYNWFFRGAKESLTTSNGGRTCTLVTTKGFGEICVGVRYSSGTSYVEYCKTITNCSARVINNEGITPEKNLLIFPNPCTDGKFNIQLKTTTDVKIFITDIIGNKVFDAFYKNSDKVFNKDIDISKTEKGIYL